MMEIVGNIIIGIGLVFMAFGVLGLYKFKDFYLRLLVLAKIDTVGAITFMVGIIIRHGFSFFSLKVFLIMVLFLILNPLTAHIIARTAYLSIEGITQDQDDGRGGR
ncbi:MAG: monovalent cation/H(+) antiporter subunit G [Oscillospiraceae bacterium]|nr:monovalent cation/H(+) antiporter subunit G [Oscillospiraceae bacterium]